MLFPLSRPDVVSIYGLQKKIVLKLSNESQKFHQVKIIYTTIYIKIWPSYCAGVLNSTSIPLTSSPVSPWYPTAPTEPTLGLGQTLPDPPISPWMWQLETGTHQSGTCGCGVKGDVEEIRFGAKRSRMGRHRLPNPFCCSTEMDGENKRVLKFRVKLWRRRCGRENPWITQGIRIW